MSTEEEAGDGDDMVVGGVVGTTAIAIACTAALVVGSAGSDAHTTRANRTTSATSTSLITSASSTTSEASDTSTVHLLVLRV